MCKDLKDLGQGTPKFRLASRQAADSAYDWPTAGDGVAEDLLELRAFPSAKYLLGPFQSCDVGDHVFWPRGTHVPGSAGCY